MKFRDLYKIIWPEGEEEPELDNMSDEDLLRIVANIADLSEERTLRRAAREVDEKVKYDEFFRTKELSPGIRQELRTAYRILS